MPTPDLPVELWLEILGYLPRSALHKMIGVNRLLFELALDDLYEEIRLISDDKSMLKTFKQLKHTNIARRARHLIIRPAFLPGMDETISGSAHKRSKSGFTYLKNLTRKPSSILSSQDPHNPAQVILDAAKASLKCCLNLHEVTIILHDHAPTPSFTTFLNSQWASKSIGANLRRLSIDTTAAKMPLLLKPLVRNASTLTNLEEVDLGFAVSRFVPTQTERFLASQALTSFFYTFRRALTSLALSSSIIFDLASLFESFPRFSKLKKLELLIIFNVQTFSHTGYLSQFIAKHELTLEHLIIKPRPRHVSFEHSDDTYSVWLYHGNTQASEELVSFSQLRLPKLRTLEVGLRDMRHHWSEVSSRPVLAKLASITPNLTSLILTDVFLNFERLSYILAGLARVEGVIALERFEFYADLLSALIFDLLAKDLTRLHSLAINYSVLSSIAPGRNASLMCQEKSNFIEDMRPRRYPTWGLQTLRLTTSTRCGAPHPAPYISVLAQCFPQDIIFDCSLHCECSFK